jgi:hypothetical protein
MSKHSAAGVVALAAGLMLTMTPAGAASAKEASCGPKKAKCQVEVVIPIGEDDGDGEHRNHGKATVPRCEALSEKKAFSFPPDDGDPKDWVEVPCLEGGALTSLWVRRSEMVVDPAQLARRLLDQVQLEPISIGLAPKGAGAMALVGLPVWVWVDHPTRTSWGPATITAGGVSLTAKVESVTWTFGDGSSISCGKGTEWKRGMGGNPSPTCGHTYIQQGTFTVTARSHWVARWSGYGQSGTIPVTTSVSRRLTVAEIQVLVTNR